MMKQKIFTKIIAAVFIGITLTFTGICIFSCNSVLENKRIKKYHDVEIFIQNKYLDEAVFGEKVYHIGIDAKYFLPAYDRLEYNNFNLDFYLFDGTNTMTLTAVTLVLDLEFIDEDEYEYAKRTEESLYTFMADIDVQNTRALNFTLGNFECKTVTDENYPRQFGLLCFNDTDHILRYLYFEEWEAPEYIQDREYISNCTNCPW